MDATSPPIASSLPIPPPPHAAASPSPVGPVLADGRVVPFGAIESHDRRLVRTSAAFYGIVILFAIGYATFSGTIGAVFGEETPSGSTTLAAVVVGLGIVGLCRLGAVGIPSVARAADAFGELLGPITGGAAILIAILSGFAEELLFRGALWPHLGLVGTSALFALVHVVPRRSLLVYPLFALGAGLLFGLLRQGGANVLPPMLAHAIVNGMNLAWIGRRRARALAPR